MSDLRSPLARARDAWFASEEGVSCLAGVAEGQWLRNRLERAFLAGVNAAESLSPPAPGETAARDASGVVAEAVRFARGSREPSAPPSGVECATCGGSGCYAVPNGDAGEQMPCPNCSGRRAT